MAETFHFFGQLPGELRSKIWQLAIRDDKRGVHLFHIYDPGLDKDVGSTRDIPYLPMSGGDFRVAAPRCREDSSISMSVSLSTSTICTPIIRDRWSDRFKSASRIDGNISMYTVDGGLWTACKESRYYMERFFLPEQWPIQKKKERLCHGAYKPCTTYFCKEEERAKHSTEHMHQKTKTRDIQYLTVRPHLDLFFLQPHCLEAFPWHHISSSSRGMWRLANIDGIEHIALEYDPEWGIQLEKNPTHPILDTLFNVVKQLYEFSCTLWFIDYGLRRKPGVCLERMRREGRRKSEERIFYATDRQYVEVASTTGMYFRDVWEHYYEFEGENFASSFQFLQYLDDEIIDHSLSGPPDNPGTSCSVGLLACEFI